MKILFVISSLPRNTVSVSGIFKGTEPLSGTVSSSVMVAERLAQRGHQAEIMVIDGQQLVDTALLSFTDLSLALKWVEGGRVILCSADNPRDLSMLGSAGVRPWLWLHVHISKTIKRNLEKGMIEGLIVVSDTARLPVMHSPAHRSIGRIYNPLNPFFIDEGQSDNRYSSQQVVFAGYLGENKGAHRLLQTWLKTREIFPEARLVCAGSARLYKGNEDIGSFGVGTPDFEKKYVLPIVEKFGSLEEAGMTFTGLLSPQELRKLYTESALGVVNLNWYDFSETFCCSAVEMLATGLPVLSVARGALPETIGPSGGAVLLSSPDDVFIAQSMVDLLNAPERLMRMGNNGRKWVKEQYELDRIVDCWEKMISSGSDKLDSASGRWQGPKGARYWIERLAGRAGCGRVLDVFLWLARKLNRKIFHLAGGMGLRRVIEEEIE